MAHSGSQPPPGPPRPPRPRPRRSSTSSCLSTASTVVIKQEPREREDVADGLGEDLVEDTERVEQPDGGSLPIVITGFQGNADDLWSEIEVAESMESIKQEYDSEEVPVNLVQIKSEPEEAHMPPHGSSMLEHQSIGDLVDVGEAPVLVKSEPGEWPQTNSSSNSIEELVDVGEACASVQVKSEPGEGPQTMSRSNSIEELVDVGEACAPVQVKSEPGEGRQTRSRSNSIEEWSAYEQRVVEAQVHDVKTEPSESGDSENDGDEENSGEDAGVPEEEEGDVGEKQSVRPARPSTTLLPATKASVDPAKLEEMKRQAAYIMAKHQRERAERAKEAEKARPRTSMEPATRKRGASSAQNPADQSQAVPKKHRRSASPDQSQAVVKKHRSSTSPNQNPADQSQAVVKKHRRSASPYQNPADQSQAVVKKHRSSTSPKDHPSGVSPLRPPGVSRNHHSPSVLKERRHSGPMTPSPHNSPLDVVVNPEQCARSEARPRRVSEEATSFSSTDSGGGGGRRVAHRPPPQFLEEGATSRHVEMPIRDPRLLRRDNLMPYPPQLLSLSPPRDQRQPERPQERHRTPPREPGVVPKRGLLKTPPDHMRLPPFKHDCDGPSRDLSEPEDDPSPKKTRTLIHMNSTVKFPPEENERESDNSSEDEHANKRPSAGHKKRMLPPATNPTKYEPRSPLDQQDEEPRKTYDTAKLSASSPRDRLLYTICSWNPKWISIPEGSKDFPDLLNDGEKYSSKKDLVQFSSGHAYRKHFQNGLFLEMWSNLCKIVLDARKKGPVLITAEVEGEPQELPLLGNIKRRTIICHCGTGSGDENKTIQKYDVVIVHSEKSRYFAYVVAQPKTKCISDKVDLPHYLCKNRHGKKFTHKCSFSLMVVVPIDNSVDPVKLISIEKVKNINDDLETMKSLEFFLSSSSLSTLVMQPKYDPSNKSVVTKYEALLSRELRPSLLSLIQDIKGNEAPSINVIEGGPGTGKSHLAAVLTKELASTENYVILTSKSNHELNTLAKLLTGSKLKVEYSKEKDGVGAVWCGSKRSGAEWENLEKISLDNVGKEIDLKAERNLKAWLSLNKKKEFLKKAIDKIETSIGELNACGKSAQAASLKTSSAQKKIDLCLVESKIEKACKPVLKKNSNPSEILQKCNILLTTFSPPLYCLEAFKNMQRQCKRVVLIVDNASEVVEPIIIRLIVAFTVTDVVLFGDIKQHAPFVPSERARNSGLVVSLMERYSRALRDTEFPPKSRLLTSQFRLHPHVFLAINDHFYNNTMSRMDQTIRTHAFQPYIWFHCSYFSQGLEKFQQEADFAEKLLNVVCKSSPYCTRDRKIRSHHVRVTSLCPKVSKILSSSKSGLPFTPSNHLNSLEFDVLILCVGSATRVAAHKIITPWTRAKRSLFVCGSFDHQSIRGPPMTNLLRKAQENGYLKEITSAQITEEKLAEKIKKH